MNQARHPGGRNFLRALAGASLAVAAMSATALKVDMYAIGNWSGGTCAPGDTDANRTSWPGMVRAWYNRMGSMGHSKTGDFTDGNMTVRRFCDPMVNAGCQDSYYVDWPDAAIVAVHGFNTANRWGGLMRNSALGTCSSVMGGTTGNMFVGDGNLKFLHASSCLSLNDTYLSNMRFAMKKTSSSKGLHHYSGFHGLMWISSSFNDDYNDVAFYGHIQPVATAWVTQQVKSNQMACEWYDPFNWFGTCQDQCPVAMTIGPSGANALNRLLNERYNNAAAFGSPSGRSHYAWMGYPGCDPVGENAFNPYEAEESAMSTVKKIVLTAAAVAAATLLPAAGWAQEQNPLERTIAARLASILGEGSTAAVVERLMAVKPAEQLSKNFNLSSAVSQVFGKLSPSFAPDCRATRTNTGEADETLCIVENGSRDAERGAYTMLAFSKNVGLGNVAVVRRDAFDPNATTLPSPVKLSDRDAYAAATDFLRKLGLPMSEVPAVPQNVALPVRTLEAAAVNERGTTESRIALQKVVILQRAFVVPGGLLADRQGRRLDHVLAPGRALVTLTDGGVRMVRIDGWVDAQMDPRIDPRQAKTTQQLAAEIAEDLRAEGVRNAGTLSILIALRRALPHPDDPDPPLCPVCGVLRPALTVMIAQPGRDPVETSEKQWMPPGVVRQYDLVAPADVQRPAR